MVQTENDNFISRVKKLIDSPHLSDWEEGFLSSLKTSLDKWGRLTAKQHSAFQSIESRNDPARVVAWTENFTGEMREQVVFAASYYKANPPYFSDVAERILTDEKYIPSEKLYRKLVDNRYVQRAIANAAAAPKFPAGSMAMVRDSLNVQHRLTSLRGQLVMVIDVEENVRSATKGARKVTILPVGDDQTIITEERYLKTAKV